MNQQQTEPIRHLVIMRHAKSAWPDGVADHERPLNDRGRRDAPAAGTWLSAHDLVPDVVLCSSAVRTRQTAELVCAELGTERGTDAPIPQPDDTLYAAPALQLLLAINHVPDAVDTLMLVAHMPGVLELALHLASPDSDPDAYQRATGHFPTSAFTVFEVQKPWAELDGQDARLVQFVVPRAH